MAPLTWNQVTNWRLARGHLTRRVPTTKLVRTVVDMCGAHAQLASSVPLALGARLSQLRQEHVDTALQEDRSLIKTWAMRGTLHVLAAEDLPLYCAAQGTRDQYMNASFLKSIGLDFSDVEAILDAIPRALDGQLLTREELTVRILSITERPHLEEHLRSGWGELLKPAAFRGLLCFGPQAGRSATFVRPDLWLGRWERFDTDDALRRVFRRFLAAYAPATREEIARWWGVRPAEAGRVLKLMGEDLAEVEVGGGRRLVLASDLRAMRSTPPVEGVRLLPSFDQVLVMSAPHPEAIVDAEFADRIYRPRIAVWSFPAVLVDGRVRASWRLERKRDRGIVRVDPFEKLSRSSLSGLAGEAERLYGLLGTDTRLEVTSG